MTANEGIINSPRKIALTAGIFYLLTFVSIPTLALYEPVHDPGYVTGPGPDADVFTGAILEIIVALTCIGSAVVLYPVLKKQNKIAALGLVSSRILEASTIFAGVAFLLAVVTLRQSGLGADAIITAQALVALYDRIFLIGQGFIPAVNDLLLGVLLYRSRLVPRILCVIGIAGSFLLVYGDYAVLLGYIEQRVPSTVMLAIPVAFFEFFLGIWLVVKGFNPSAPILMTTETNT